MTALSLTGVLTAGQVRRTAEHIAGQQLPSGLIPWFEGHFADPWDHVEAAMALTVGGLPEQARAAYLWSAANQADDGGWPMEVVSDGRTERPTDAGRDANQVAYLAVGVWHHWQVMRDRALVDQLWPVVRRAIDLVCDLQRPDGAIAWARDPEGRVHTDALLTGSACLVLSLRCALQLADLVGDARPDWELAVVRLAHAVDAHPDAFEDRGRWSMDWYYPVLGGAVRGDAARAHLASRWEEFVVPERGARCVADRPWVTVAETCELVLTLDAVGDDAAARRLLRDVQWGRDDDGGYWTGWVWPEDVFWPEEKTTWTAAAVLLATDALARHSGGHAVLRGTELPPMLELGGCDEHCTASLPARRDAR